MLHSKHPELVACTLWLHLVCPHWLPMSISKAAARMSVGCHHMQHPLRSPVQQAPRHLQRWGTGSSACHGGLDVRDQSLAQLSTCRLRSLQQSKSRGSCGDAGKSAGWVPHESRGCSSPSKLLPENMLRSEEPCHSRDCSPLRSGLIRCTCCLLCCHAPSACITTTYVMPALRPCPCYPPDAVLPCLLPCSCSHECAGPQPHAGAWLFLPDSAAGCRCLAKCHAFASYRADSP